jgi:hypothetical protein
VACTTGQELGSQGRRAAGVAPRGRGAAPPGRPAAARLGRPGGAGRAGAAAAPSGLAPVVCAALHAAWLASRSGSAPVDLPSPAWPSDGDRRTPPARPAAGYGEPDLGVPPGGTAGSTAKSTDSDTNWEPALSGLFCSALGLIRRRSDQPSPGDSSSATRPRACWPRTSSPSTRCAYSGCTSSSTTSWRVRFTCSRGLGWGTCGRRGWRAGARRWRRSRGRRPARRPRRGEG